TSSDGETTEHLALRGADGTDTERKVSGDTCSEVVSALALIAAIAVDPEPAANPKPAPAPQPPPIAPPAAAPALLSVSAPAASADKVVRASRSDPRSWHFAVEVA